MIKALFPWIALENQLRFYLISASNDVPKLITLSSVFQWKHFCQLSPKLPPGDTVAINEALDKNGEFSYPRRWRRIQATFQEWTYIQVTPGTSPEFCHLLVGTWQRISLEIS